MEDHECAILRNGNLARARLLRVMTRLQLPIYTTYDGRQFVCNEHLSAVCLIRSVNEWKDVEMECVMPFKLSGEV